MRLGKDKQAILLAVFLLLSASAGGQAGKSFKYQFDGNLQKSDAITENQSLIINYSISELNVECVTNDNGSFYRVSIAGHTPTATPGKPELPVFSRLISIPDGSEYNVKISEVRSSKINPSGEKLEGVLFPVQEGETKEVQQRKPDFKIDKTVYAARGLISSDTVRIESLGIVRNNKLANLYVFPVRYNPHSNVLEVITSMKIEITFSYPDNIVSKSLLPESALFNESLGKGVLNYNPRDVIPGYSDQPVKMVIITDSAFRKQLEPFLKWKTQKGFKLKVLYKGAGLAGNTYTQLKDTLTNIYKASSETDPPPEYLLIIGDVNRVPYLNTGYPYYNITDMYYGEFDGNGDYIPEMYIGRLPVADTTELKSVVNKIIQYEKFQFADTNKFYSRALAAAGKDAYYANYMNGQVKYAISNYLTKINKINEYHFYNQSASNDSIKKLINFGVSFINYTGHGSSDGWLYSKDPPYSYYLKTLDVGGLVNKNMYPFVISNACQTAMFNIASSFGNKMVLSGEKGAIGFIGCSANSYWDEDYYWAVGPRSPSADSTYQGTGLGAYDRLFHTHGEPASDWYFTMGQVNYAGNLAVSASTSSWKKYYWETYNLMGDPSVIPILGKPDTFNISLPDTLPNGIKSLSLNIEPFAYLSVSHFDTLWDASFASPSGSVTLDMPGLSYDSCMIVITGQNKLPLIKTIYFSDVNKEFINLTSTGINDSQGDGNGQADFGETFYLNLKVSNLGLTDASGLYAKISSSSDWITINNDSVLIGNLPAKSDTVLSNNLGIAISDNVPDKGLVTIKLMLKDQKSEKHYTIDICIHASELQILNCIIDDKTLGNGDQIADPGEIFNLVFKVRNQGSSDISGQFTIVSPNEKIEILDLYGKSGIMKFGEITDIPIKVKLPETISSGSFILVSATLNCSPFLINKDFSFRVGRIRESFESLSFNVFPWINNSKIPWSIAGTSSYDGSISARSGAINDNGSTSLIIRTIYATADSVKFFYKVSSETNYDFLSFRLNGTEVFKKSGETGWTKKAIPVTAGLNKMEWIYYKDGTKLEGSDCAWIDMIDFAGSGTVKYIQKDIQVARIVTPVQKDQNGQGTVTVKVMNIGKDTLNGFNLAYEVNDHLPPVTQYFENPVIPYGDSCTVSFKTKTDMSKSGIYKITAYVVDNNDDYIFNDTLRVSFENKKIDEIFVFPNPFTDQFTILINSQAADKLQISITNISGVKLYNVEKEIISGKNAIIISDVRLLPSLYYLNIRGATVNKTIFVLKINK
ncbi:MAG: C25 family cysteine peptidase [Bacteroidia bacterium]|nr:C25 family cysteine peptidase [Bacteroidia bacterium]